MRQTNLQLLRDIYGSNYGTGFRDRVIDLLRAVINDQKVLFAGYANPYFDMLQDDDVSFAVPAEYGKQTMPLSKKTVLLEAKKLPFSDNSFDIVVAAHLLEFSRYSAEFLHEFARVLYGQGTLINLSLNKHLPKRKIRSSNNIFQMIENNHKFEIKKIIGLGNGLQIWPYDFDVNVSKYNVFLMNMLPMLSDMVLIRASKIEFAPISAFEPSYGIANG